MVLNGLNSVAEDVFPEAQKRLDLYHLKKACGIVLDEAGIKYFEPGSLL